MHCRSHYISKNLEQNQASAKPQFFQIPTMLTTVTFSPIKELYRRVIIV
jgi:hypothetical protein